MFFTLVLISIVVGNVEFKQNMKRFKNSSCGDKGNYYAQEICLDALYDKTKIPYQTDMVVDVIVEHFLVAEVSDEKSTLTFHLILEMQWEDPQIKANFSTPEEEKDIRNEVGDLIWKPDTQIYGLTDRKAMADSIDVQEFRLFFQKSSNIVKIKWTRVGRISIYCERELVMYPFDDESCELTFLNRGPTDIIFQSGIRHSKIQESFETYHAAGFEISTTLMEEKRKNRYDITLKLHRIFQPYLFKYYLPSTAIVCISGTGLLFPLNPLPGRISLGVTQFLTLTNLFIHNMVILV